MTYKAFDVVAVPFPFTDRDASKRRPALVISNERFNKQHKQVVLAMITTTTETSWPSDVSLAKWQAAGLKVACHFQSRSQGRDTSSTLLFTWPMQIPTPC